MRKLNRNELYAFLKESVFNKVKKVSKTDIGDVVDNNVLEGDKGIVKNLLMSIYEIAPKIKGSKYREYGEYKEYTIPCCSIQRDLGSMEYPEGIVCLRDKTSKTVSFEWNLQERGVSRMPNYGTVNFKDKDDVRYWCSYGFDENIPNFIVPAKYSRKQEWNGRTLKHHAYNVFLESIHYKEDENKIVLRWLWGCSRDGYSVDDEMKKDFESCSKVVKNKIIKCLRNKLELMRKSLLS